eukprot:1203961-Pyramimonas_sp.AAC.2
MAHPTDDDTVVILRKLAYFIPSFYALYYAVALLYLLAFDLPMDRFGYVPFNFEDDDFKPLYRDSDEDDRELPLGEHCLSRMKIPVFFHFILHHRVVSLLRRCFSRCVGFLAAFK